MSIEDQLRAFYAVEMPERAVRPLGDERTERVEAFTEHLRSSAARRVLEVGCGAGRDGRVLDDGTLEYVGLDLSGAAVRMCRDLGLPAVEASAVGLPFADGSFDAAWSMSTLMHLPGDGLARAVAELRRVVRTGGTVEIGVWGHTTSGPWTSPDGRYFNHRTDADLVGELGALGRVVDHATWGWFDDGGHYQWARVVVG